MPEQHRETPDLPGEVHDPYPVDCPTPSSLRDILATTGDMSLLVAAKAAYVSGYSWMLYSGRVWYITGVEDGTYGTFVAAIPIGTPESLGLMKAGNVNLLSRG